MTDIDFDELDRAVNSLMQPKQPSSKQPPAKPEATQPQPDPAVEIVPDYSADEQSSVPTSVPTQSESSVPASSQPVTQVETPAPEATPDLSNESAKSEASSALAEASRAKVSTKKRGQFMDVMHTSSNMKQSDPAPKLAPRKSTVTLQPSASPQPAQPSKPALVSEPVKMTNSEPVKTAQAEWADPIDMMTRHEDKLALASSAQSATEEVAIEESSTPVEPSVAPVDNEPLASPFLPDTKVDKRPLGGVQPSQGVQAEPVPDPELADADSDSDQKPVEADATALPEELQQDVLAIEADMAAKANQEAVAASKAAQQAEEAASVESTLTPSKSVPSPAVTPAAARQTSLPQSPLPPIKDTDGEPDSSIFDTEQYQAPIKHPVKRKSGWPVIVAIIALVVLGTGGGIAFYLLSNGY